MFKDHLVTILYAVFTGCKSMGWICSTSGRLYKNNLNDPGCYKSVNWSEVVKLNDTKEMGFASYQVRYKYRAKNAFGEYVTEEKLFKLDYQGNVVEVRDWIR